MKVCVLASGSSGNCTFIEVGGIKFLVDAGISAKRIVEGLRSIGERIEDIEGILLTHEHRDHVAGIERLTLKYKLRLYSNRATMRCLPIVLRSGQWIELTHKPLVIEEIEIQPFSVNHDAIDPVGFRVSNSHNSVGVVTDIGSLTKLVQERLEGVTALVIEANYDHNMLMNGPYPWDLKQRIASRLGHLSNIECGEFLANHTHPGLKLVFLAHRSEKNNDPQLSLDTVQQKIGEAGTTAPPIQLTHQHKIAEPWND